MLIAQAIFLLKHGQTHRQIDIQTKITNATDRTPKPPLPRREHYSCVILMQLSDAD